jgi:hypothetical protein
MEPQTGTASRANTCAASAELQIFVMRIDPFELDKSIDGPPLPIVPSISVFDRVPCVRISKSLEIEECDVFARTRAFASAGSRSVTPVLDLVPFARPGRVVPDYHFQPSRVAEFLQVVFPRPVPGGIASSAVGADE